MISGGKRHREHRHSLHLPRLASASKIPSLHSLILELEGCLTHTSWAPRSLSFLSFFFLSLSLSCIFAEWRTSGDGIACKLLLLSRFVQRTIFHALHENT